uniref:Saposin B-type domain-containing protein n=1 Tax=Steinernema glaseri TaxID=37863 RepID=A0A1I7ZDL8_9BILA
MLIRALLTMLVLLFAFSLLYSASADHPSCVLCKQIIGAAYAHDVQNYVNDVTKFEKYWSEECTFLRMQIDPALGNYCFWLYRTNQAELMKEFFERIPAANICSNLKQC